MSSNLKAAQQASTRGATAMPNAPPRPYLPCRAGASRAPKYPCAGFGLATRANASEYSQDFRELRDEWGDLTPAQRRARMERMVNRQLAKGGVPNVGIREQDTGGAGGGFFDFEQWDLNIDEATINSDTLSDADARQLSLALYHESRHAEQWYLMARRRATTLRNMRGTNARQRARRLRRELTIPANVAARAEKHPLPGDSKRKPCADRLYGSVYGKNAERRNRTLDNLTKRTTALERAESRYGVDSPEYRRAYDAYQRAYRAYRGLPEEADAYYAERLVRK